MIENIKRLVNEHRTLMVVLVGLLLVFFLYWFLCCKDSSLDNKVKGGGDYVNEYILYHDNMGPEPVSKALLTNKSIIPSADAFILARLFLKTYDESRLSQFLGAMTDVLKNANSNSSILNSEFAEKRNLSYDYLTSGIPCDTLTPLPNLFISGEYIGQPIEFIDESRFDYFFGGTERALFAEAWHDGDYREWLQVWSFKPSATGISTSENYFVKALYKNSRNWEKRVDKDGLAWNGCEGGHRADIYPASFLSVFGILLFIPVLHDKADFNIEQLEERVTGDSPLLNEIKSNITKIKENPQRLHDYLQFAIGAFAKIVDLAWNINIDARYKMSSHVNTKIGNSILVSKNLKENIELFEGEENKMKGITFRWDDNLMKLTKTLLENPSEENRRKFDEYVDGDNDPSNKENFTRTVWYALKVSKVSQKNEEQLGVRWVDDDYFEINIDIFVPIMDVKENTLLANLKSCEFAVEQADRVLKVRKLNFSRNTELEKPTKGVFKKVVERINELCPTPDLQPPPIVNTPLNMYVSSVNIQNPEFAECKGEKDRMIGLCAQLLRGDAGELPDEQLGEAEKMVEKMKIAIERAKEMKEKKKMEMNEE